MRRRMRLRTRLMVQTSLVMLFPALTIVDFAREMRLSERRLANVAATSTLRLWDAREATFAAAWQGDLARLQQRLGRLVVALCDPGVLERVARRDSAAVHTRLRQLFDEDGSDAAFVLASETTLFAAGSFMNVGRHDLRLAAVTDEEISPFGAACDDPTHDASPVPVVTGPDPSVVVWMARRISVGSVAVVAVVGTPLRRFSTVTGHQFLRLEGRSAANVEAGTWLVAGARPDGPMQGTHREIADVGWLGWGPETETVRGPLLVVLPPFAAELPSWSGVLIVASVLSMLLALCLNWRLAAAIARPVERLAAIARSVRLGRRHQHFPKGGGIELEDLAVCLNDMLDRIDEETVRASNYRKRAILGKVARQVNHDMRNPLASISHVLRHLFDAQQDGPDALAEAFAARSKNLNDNVDQLTGLADNYWEDPQALLERRARADLRAVALAVTEAAPRAPGVRVDVNLGDPPAWVEMDDVSLRSVIENLVVNAVEALPEGTGGVVRVRLERRGQDGGGPAGWLAYRLLVTDDGPGIAVDELNRVFEDGFTTKNEGTGLGLASARSLVRKVGGDITVESELGRRTEFAVELPAAESPSSR